MNLCNAGTLDAIAPEMRILTIQTIIYFILASLAALMESKRNEASSMQE